MSHDPRLARSDRRRNLVGAAALLAGVLVVPSGLAAQQSAPADTAAKAAPKAGTGNAIKLDGAQICAMLRNAMGQMGQMGQMGGGQGGAKVEIAASPVTAKADSSAASKVDSAAHAGHTDSPKVEVGPPGGGGQAQSFSC